MALRKLDDTACNQNEQTAWASWAMETKRWLMRNINGDPEVIGRKYMSLVALQASMLSTMGQVSDDAIRQFAYELQAEAKEHFGIWTKE